MPENVFPKRPYEKAAPKGRGKGDGGPIGPAVSPKSGGVHPGTYTGKGARVQMPGDRGTPSGLYEQ